MIGRFRLLLGQDVDGSGDVEEQGPEAARDALEAESMMTTKTSASVSARLIFRRRAAVRRHDGLEPVGHVARESGFAVPMMLPDRAGLKITGT